MSKSELKKCYHCGRHNWHEVTHCSWCMRKFPYLNIMDKLNWLIAICSIIAIVSLGIVAFSIGGKF
jgi:hypothetical protein